MRWAADIGYGSVARDDVAATLLAVLEAANTIGKAFDLFEGDTPVEEAVRSSDGLRVLRRARSLPPGPRDHLRRPVAGRAALRRRGALPQRRRERPWQRVVRADGSLAKGERQRRLLEAEGVPFRGERVDMRRAWLPPPG